MAETTDILISGGGIAGLTAAAAFAASGFQVICVDPLPPAGKSGDADDPRTTAFLQPAQRFLERIGLWERLAPHATALNVIRIVDATGPDSTAHVTKDFNAADISDKPFGWNLPNRLVRREIASHLAEIDMVDLRSGVASDRLLTRADEARVHLSDGSTVISKLVIAADGRDSPIRRAIGIDVKTRRYGQKALTFAVTHPLAHANISIEIHRSGGPFTLVPMPDRDGLPCSAVVWMENGPTALALADMEKTAFETEMAHRSAHVLGPLKLATHRSVWPIIGQIADRFSAARVALIAEAAHVVPPIGAQGLNMSLGDIRTLLDLAKAMPNALGAARMLDAYDRRRRIEDLARAIGVDLLNRASMSGNPILQKARRHGLNALHTVKPAREMLMRLGLGTHERPF
ncbi:MAG: UbiH/UbiF family hydroxylase [Pseudomonadota bacterium]